MTNTICGRHHRTFQLLSPDGGPKRLRCAECVREENEASAARRADDAAEGFDQGGFGLGESLGGISMPDTSSGSDFGGFGGGGGFDGGGGGDSF